MYLPALPAGADDGTRLAYASFGLNILLLPVLRNSHLSEEGYHTMTKLVVDAYGQGESPAAKWIRDSLPAMGAPTNVRTP